MDGLEKVIIVGGADLDGTGLSKTMLLIKKDIDAFGEANGLNDLKVKPVNTNPNPFSHETRDEIIRIVKDGYDKNEPLIVYGYSLGAVKANDAINYLSAEGIEVKHFITVDAAIGPLSLPIAPEIEVSGNVIRQTNFFPKKKICPRFKGIGD